MTAPKPFAKLFTHSELGQVLIQRCTNDSGDEGCRITFDARIEGMHPVELFLGAKGKDEDEEFANADGLFEKLDEATATSIVERQVKRFHNQPSI